MRTYTREKFRRRDRQFPAIRGHSRFDNEEFIPDDYGKTTTPYGKFVTRQEWGAAPSLGSEGKLTHPVMYINTVYVLLEAEDGGMEQGLKGPEAVRLFQEEDMNAGMKDIRSSFIIDEDGLIYEGRGWYDKPAITKKEHPSRFTEYLEICYIGEYSQAPLNHPVNFATAKLMNIARLKKYVSREALMLSPEAVMYERIREPVRDLFLPPNQPIRKVN